jgi:hypothetical protein
MYFHRIKNIEALENYQLKVEFVTGEIKRYDCRPLLEKEAFKELKNENLFRKVRVDTGGYGIVWSDEIDLSESELWINGKTENSQVADDITPYGKD